MEIVNNALDVKKTSVQTVKKILADGTSCVQERDVLIEHFLDVYVNGTIFFKLTCTNSMLVELVLGRLITEGIIADKEEIKLLSICQYGRTAKVFLEDSIDFSLCKAREASCCTDNIILRKSESLELKSLPPFTIKNEWIFNLANAFSKDSSIHKKTNGTHTCILALKDKILCSTEDIGRHNALDKAIGYIALNNIPKEECILFTTGRVPLDMVQKVIAAGIPCLVSKSVPTTAAIDLAKRYNLNLICRAWPDSFELSV